MTNAFQIRISNSRNSRIRCGIFAVALLLAGSSCKKNQLNGKSVIRGSVVHHSKAIPHARVFIKFNSTEFPGSDTTGYDAKISADAQGKFSVNVYKGSYYLYGYGLDLALAEPEVAGGVPVKIRHRETLEITVAVTEKH